MMGKKLNKKQIFMKKGLSLLFMFFMLSTVYLNAQIAMFKGISSGITETELTANLRSNAEFTFQQVSADESYFQTVISGRTYVLSYAFNEKGLLNMIIFSSSDKYDTLNYGKVLENGKEIYALLYARYGEPYYGDWINWTSVGGGQTEAYYFGPDPDVAQIFVACDAPGTFFIRLVFKDTGLILANMGENPDETDDYEEYDF
jgi:hypothetical protein